MAIQWLPGVLPPSMTEQQFAGLAEVGNVQFICGVIYPKIPDGMHHNRWSLPCRSCNINRMDRVDRTTHADLAQLERALERGSSETIPLVMMTEHQWSVTGPCGDSQHILDMGRCHSCGTIYWSPRMIVSRFMDNTHPIVQNLLSEPIEVGRPPAGGWGR